MIWGRTRQFICWLALGILLCLPISAAAQSAALPSRFDRPIAPGGPDPALFQEALRHLVNAGQAKHRAMTHRLPDPNLASGLRRMGAG